MSDWLRTLAPASRFVLQGGPAARAAAGAVFGVPLSEMPCRANSREDRAALWLGPDEYLLLAPAAESRDSCRRLRPRIDRYCAFTRGCQSAPDRTRTSRSPRGRDPELRMSAGSRSRGVSCRHVHAHAVRQGGHRSVAHGCHRIPPRGVALLLGLHPGMPAGGCPGIHRAGQCCLTSGTGGRSQDS